MNHKTNDMHLMFYFFSIMENNFSVVNIDKGMLTMMRINIIITLDTGLIGNRLPTVNLNI